MDDEDLASSSHTGNNDQYSWDGDGHEDHPAIGLSGSPKCDGHVNSGTLATANRQQYEIDGRTFVQNFFTDASTIDTISEWTLNEIVGWMTNIYKGNTGTVRKFSEVRAFKFITCTRGLLSSHATHKSNRV